MIGYTEKKTIQAQHPAADGIPVNALDEDQMHEMAIALVSEFGVNRAIAICHQASWRGMLKMIEDGYTSQ